VVEQVAGTDRDRPGESALTPDAYTAFTETLRARLEADPRVVGLVALGSMARRDYEPDRWSDHDFFVITNAGEQEAFRADLSWLPFSSRIVFSYRETPHGVTALYEDGHLVEFAVFDPGELPVARVNRYRVLLDRRGRRVPTTRGSSASS
jgi:lincosamide nucleotidyltransferase